MPKINNMHRQLQGEKQILNFRLLNFYCIFTLSKISIDISVEILFKTCAFSLVKYPMEEDFVLDCLAYRENNVCMVVSDSSNFSHKHFSN